ncbi:hypothetical protein FIU87_06370 [Bacillus sp. THAF10]|uniref:DUF3267 domain-containing protein n=1 Tax=Bacillus sp. THAF10 TaxID=2587848 RepID=UPI001267AF3E|nr:DUF3267 domain-containing protein [Bacillus sp. THAF10]QFT88260.1 hypothetical protein FIU87_06370 [Bacillus sp. THAF10]
MNCWKSIDLTRQYGFHRITLISFIVTLLSFIVFYLSFSLYYHDITVSSANFGWFILALAAIFTLHKLCHALPLIATLNQVAFQWKFKWFMPYMKIKTKKPFTKLQSYVVFMAPFAILTTSFVLLSHIFPSYYHYFSILTAVNIGLCIPDFIYVKLIQRAPSKCQIEELDHGYDILIVKDNEIAS